jgi:hypothetical protein
MLLLCGCELALLQLPLALRCQQLRKLQLEGSCCLDSQVGRCCIIPAGMSGGDAALLLKPLHVHTRYTHAHKQPSHTRHT